MSVLKGQRRSKYRASTLLVACIACCIIFGAYVNLQWNSKGDQSYRYYAVQEAVSSIEASAQMPILDNFDIKKTTEITKQKKQTSTSTLEAYYYDTNFSMFAIPAKQWSKTSSFIPTELKIYVYDTLPAKFTTDVEDCLIDTYTNINTVDHVENFKAELGLVNLFRTYPSRTYDATEAELFVVPYAAEGHCQCQEGYTWNCAQVKTSDMDEMRSQLLYLNETTKRRHLFILAGARAKPFLWSKPLKLTTAPAMRPPGQIVIPNLEDKAPYQPSALLHRGEEWWTTRPRTYAFSFIYGGANAKMNGGGGRKYRHYLEADIAANYPSNILRGGQAFYMKRWSSPHDFHKVETFAYYNSSIFCPCLPGDLAWQKRFFDAILNGCLPVVLQFDTPNMPGGKSWFLPEGASGEVASVQQTYPFAKGEFIGQGDLEIQYDSFVVAIPMDHVKDPKNVSGVLQTIERILADPAQLRRRQLAMMKAAMAFTYGMGKDAHQYDDAFAHILKALRYYLDYKLNK